MPFPVQVKEIQRILQTLYFTSYKATPQILKMKCVQMFATFVQLWQSTMAEF